MCSSDLDYKTCTLVQNFPKQDKRLSIAPRSFPPEKTPTLIYLGNISAIRGVHAYLELARRLKEKQRPFRMVLIGEHPVALHQKLQEKLKTWQLTDCVELHNRMDWLEAMQKVSQATIGLCLLQPIPNYTTCLATKILEYMMVGTPVLASNFEIWRPFVDRKSVV